MLHVFTLHNKPMNIFRILCLIFEAWVSKGSNSSEMLEAPFRPGQGPTGMNQGQQAAPIGVAIHLGYHILFPCGQFSTSRSIRHLRIFCLVTQKPERCLWLTASLALYTMPRQPWRPDLSIATFTHANPADAFGCAVLSGLNYTIIWNPYIFCGKLQRIISYSEDREPQCYVKTCHEMI